MRLMRFGPQHLRIANGASKLTCDDSFVVPKTNQSSGHNQKSNHQKNVWRGGERNSSLILPRQRETRRQTQMVRGAAGRDIEVKDPVSFV